MSGNPLIAEHNINPAISRGSALSSILVHSKQNPSARVRFLVQVHHDTVTEIGKIRDPVPASHFFQRGAIGTAQTDGANTVGFEAAEGFGAGRDDGSGLDSASSEAANDSSSFRFLNDAGSWLGLHVLGGRNRCSITAQLIAFARPGRTFLDDFVAVFELGRIWNSRIVRASIYLSRLASEERS
ncbi:MAG TPA: hypothetical protein VHS80_06230 [Chthoniobacterales bacterium]|nr:hypothetical protein [Chthoniobacterales bacterium]